MVGKEKEINNLIKAVQRLIQFDTNFRHVHFDAGNMSSYEIELRCPHCALKTALREVLEFNEQQ